jgi:mannose-6-phosphate isomerase-like protein (cupin superfamily)
VNLNVYLKSGVLELFVLDLLDDAERMDVLDMLSRFPVLEKEVQAIEAALQQFASSIAIEPPPSLKVKIETALAAAAPQKQMDIDHLSLIDANSDYRNWINLVSAYYPAAFATDNFKEVLRSDNGVTQVLVVSSVDIDNETHDDVYESFLILQGQCKCTVGKESFYLNPGGFTQIPLNENHRVEITSATPVMAIAQYVSVAG